MQNDPIPGPLPLGVAVIDSSVRLYGLIFPRVAHKHRYQMLQHFNECIKQAKSSRQQAVQMNIFTAVLCALKVSLEENYGKCSKISNTFLILFSNKMLVIRAETQKMLFRKANREDPDQTASEEAV